jgi:hypothetical protein
MVLLLELDVEPGILCFRKNTGQFPQTPIADERSFPSRDRQEALPPVPPERGTANAPFRSRLGLSRLGLSRLGSVACDKLMD